MAFPTFFRSPLSFLILAIALCSCGSSHPASAKTTSTISPTPTTVVAVSLTNGKKDFPKTYRAIVAPANRALAEFAGQLRSILPTATTANVASITAPFADALAVTNARLQQIAWPPTVAPDVKELIAADETVIADLRSVGSQTSSSLSEWQTKFVSDQQTVTSQVTHVLADLQHLPKP